MKEYKDLVELLKRVQATGGLDCDNESVCAYQDMIGHSSIEQLEELANGNYKEAFYRVYGLAYGTIEAIRFHCKHGEKIKELFVTIEDYKAEVERGSFLLEEEKKKTLETAKERNELQRQYNEADRERTKLQEVKERLEAENQALKAKLYDLMTA